MKKIAFFLIIISIILTGCKSQVVNTEEFSDILLSLEEKSPIVSENTDLIMDFFVKTEYDLKENLNYEGIDFIGFDEDNLYLMLWKGKGFDLAIQDRHSKDFNIISEDIEFDYVNKAFIYQGHVYIVASKEGEDNRLTLEILEIDGDGENKSIFTKSETLKMPFVDIVNNNLIFTTESYKEKEDEYNIQLQFINLDDMALLKKGDIEKVEVNNIDNKVYKVNNDKYKGEVIVGVGGLEGHILYYQTIALNNEDIDAGEGQPVIYKYNFNTKEIEKKFNSDIPVDFISGNNDILITSEHGFGKPLDESGKVFLLDKEYYNNIPNIYTGNDILDVQSLIFNNKEYLVITSINGDILFYNSEENIYYPLDFNLGEDNINFHIRENSFGYLYKDKIILYEENIPLAVDEVTEDIIEKFKTELVETDVEILYHDNKLLYYIETSNYNHRPLEKSDAIVWKYDKLADNYEKVTAFEWFYINQIDVTRNTITINYSEDKDEVIKIDIKSGKVK